MNVDYLIVGQGLAGTLLAFELLKLQKSLWPKPGIKKNEKR